MPSSIRPLRRLLMTHFLGFASLITLLVLSSLPAYAEWMAVEKDYLLPGLQTVYVDPDTIRRKVDLVKMRELYDFKIIRTVAGDSYF